MMTPDVDKILARIALLQRSIIDPVTGKAIVAYDNVPYTISVADMPLFVNFVGELSQSVMIGSDHLGRTFNETRVINMMLYHSPYGTGAEGEKMGLLTPYFSLVYNLIGKYPHLSNLGGIIDAKLSNDSGTTVVSFNGQSYFGVRFALQIVSKTRRSLAEDE